MNHGYMDRRFAEGSGWRLGALAFAGGIMLSGCSAISREERAWSFVTAVGGLEISAPIQARDGWQLPVHADVSGLQQITHKPSTMNSGLVCDSVRARVKNSEIFIVIVTSLPHEGATSVCPPAKIDSLQPGKYTVAYGSSKADGVPIGEIDVAL